VPSSPDGDPAARRYVERAGGAPEQELPRGDVTEGVVRVGRTVRRPHQAQSLAVAGYLDHLHRAGFVGAPRYLGRDGRGRDVLDHLPGDVAGDPPEPWAADERLLVSVGRLVRDLHRASAGYLAGSGLRDPSGAPWQRDLLAVDGLPAEADPPPELISHLDVTQQNVVVRYGEAVGLIDFDMAGPTTVAVDVYTTAMYWAPLRAERDVWPTWRGVDPFRRLGLLADACELSPGARAGFVDLGIARSAASRLRMAAAARTWGGGWARMWDAGVGDAISRRGRWLEEHRTEIERALSR